MNRHSRPQPLFEPDEQPQSGERHSGFECKKGDTMPCVESVRGEVVDRTSKIDIPIVEAPSEEAFASRFSSIESEIQVDQFVGRLLRLGKDFPSSLLFLRGYWAIQRELKMADPLVNKVAILEFFDLLIDAEFILPGEEPINERTWIITGIDCDDFFGSKPFQVVAKNVCTKSHMTVLLFHVLKGLVE